MVGSTGTAVSSEPRVGTTCSSAISSSERPRSFDAFCASSLFIVICPKRAAVGPHRAAAHLVRDLRPGQSLLQLGCQDPLGQLGSGHADLLLLLGGYYAGGRGTRPPIGPPRFVLYWPAQPRTHTPSHDRGRNP